MNALDWLYPVNGVQKWFWFDCLFLRVLTGDKDLAGKLLEELKYETAVEKVSFVKNYTENNPFKVRI